LIPPPVLSFQSLASTSGARTWGFYNVRTDSGNSQFHFGPEADNYALGADAWTCTQSGGTPTGCFFAPLLGISSSTATGTVLEFLNSSGSGSQSNIELTGSSSTYFPNNGLVIHDVTNSRDSFWFSNGPNAGAWALSGGIFGWSSNSTDPRAGGSSGLDTGFVRSAAGLICASSSPATYPNPPCTGTLKAAQFVPAGSAPTIAAGTGAGSSPSISVTGTNTSGVIALTTGTSPASMATVATVTFNGTLGTAP
jgi:hypothetical protein